MYFYFDTNLNIYIQYLNPLRWGEMYHNNVSIALLVQFSPKKGDER